MSLYVSFKQGRHNEIVSGGGGGAQVLFVCHLKIQEKKSLYEAKSGACGAAPVKGDMSLYKSHFFFFLFNWFNINDFIVFI